MERGQYPESSADKWEHEGKVAQRFGFAQQLELPMRHLPHRSKRPPTEATLCSVTDSATCRRSRRLEGDKPA